MKRIVFVVTVALVMVMLAVAPVFAQGGCKAFGVEGVSDQARNQEGGMGGYASYWSHQEDGLMDEQIHQSQEDLCPGSGR
jgi:hypothetical protein